ncbi:MAG: translocation/assembly module TamB domain-containing protein [Bacteroidales bacterium]|nr:translocation/assembly module TamB domain-containing protein [Bacteroidales bacterium]MDD4210039.1 translocation/assembly module TamB domain-containing protein [Bacteroidales bacterium]
MLWIFLSIVSILLIICVLFTIPSIQTYVAQQTAKYLSEQMQAEITIDKLHVTWDLDIIIKNIIIKDQHGHNLISAEYCEVDFPTIDKLNNQIIIPRIHANDAEVFLAIYEGEDQINLRFLVDYLIPKKRSKNPKSISLRNLSLDRGKFTFYNEITKREELDSHWNYSNIVIDDIFTKIDELSIIKDSLNFEITKLTCKERSGFSIKNFKGHLRISRSGLYCLNTHFTTPHSSEVYIDFGFKYNDFIDFSDFENKIAFDCMLYPSLISFIDLTYFVPFFKGMDACLQAEATDIKGCLSELSLQNTQIHIDDNNFFEGNINSRGLPDIKATVFTSEIKNLQADIKTIEKFKLPKGQKIEIPEIVKQLQWIKANGSFNGYYYDFMANATIKSEIGDGIFNDVYLKKIEKELLYQGEFTVTDLELNKLVDYKDIGNISAHGKIKGDKTNIDSVAINISSIIYKNNKISDIKITGDYHYKQFSFSCVSADPNLKAAINGMIDINSLEKSYTFVANIDTINLSNLHLFRIDSNAIVTSSGIILQFKGNTLNNIQGKVDLINVNYFENNVHYPLDDLHLSVDIDKNQTKHIIFSSNSLHIEANGIFMYEELFPFLQNEINKYLPHAITKNNAPISESTKHIDIQISMNKAISLFELLFPDFIFRKGFIAKATANKMNKLIKLSASIPTLDIHQQIFKDISIQSHNLSNEIVLTGYCHSYWMASDTVSLFNNISLQTKTAKDTIHFMAMADGNQIGTIKDAFIQGYVSFTSPKEFFCEINNGSIVIDTSTYFFDPSNYITFNKDSIFIKNIGLSNNNRRIHLYGALSSLHTTSLHGEFNKINLRDFELIFKKFMISISGEATGNASIISNQYGYNVLSNIDVNQFSFNDVYLGELKGKTIWQNDDKRLWISASIIPDERESQDLTLDLNGYFDPIKKTIDIKGDIREFNIKTLEPYVNFFASKVEGIGTGFLTYSGPITHPKLKGNILLKNGILGVSILKTEYYIKQCNIEFIDTGFIFNNIPFTDMYNNKGVINGIITHHHLKNWGVDLHIKADNLLALNTSYKDNSLFYGNVFGSGDVSIKTKDKITWIIANMKTEKQSNITINMDWNTTVRENKFIVFEKQYQEEIKADSLQPTQMNKSKLALSLHITATPDAFVRVDLDPSIGGTLKGTGSGTLRLDLTPEDKFEIYGTYMLENGNFELNLGNILARNFILTKGGTVTWSGKPTEGIVAVKATYPTRVSIANLFPENENMNTYRPIPVNSLLYLNGNILNPEFNFGIELLDVDENIKTLVYNAIDTTDREEMVRQTFSVLLMGRFESRSISTNTVNAGLGYSISELASHHLNKWMSSITDKVNLGFSYRPGDGTTSSDDYNVQVSTNLFDNRLSVQGILDIYGNNNNTMDKQPVGGNVVGDFIAEYKLTKDGSLKIKAFNVANYYDILQSPTTTASRSQGLGLSYTKHFNKLKELFVSKRKIKEKEK